MTQFLVVGLLAFAAIVVGARVLTARAANDEAIRDARRFTEVLAGSVAEPVIPRGLVDGDPGAVDRFDRVATDRLLVGDVRRIKIWSADGTIVYSDEVRLIGEHFRFGSEEREILRDGGSDAEVTDLDKPENRYERGGDGLVEVYTKIWSPEGEPLLFEAYFTVQGIEARQAAVIGPFQRITLGALAVLVCVATVLLWLLTRRAARAAAERERLLRSAATASEAERRRIARDLHDGVVQDLAGTAFTLSALARDTDEPTHGGLVAAGTALRENLRSLRSLLVEIHPPDLTAATLPAALEDLCAPAAARGVDVTVTVGELGAVTPDDAAMVWRVAQETVRNTLRHAQATTMTVGLQRHGDRLVLAVTDDGTGFDPAAVSATAHYGLRGLESLVRDTGGTLAIRSRPGEGTSVRLEVGG
ncbi:sensor histidine kinase [Nocardioides panacisoli]|uniref:histidine kinase n=1 Tax=Nocardioides panacisoli TaxID=627624 RepID=A0ABP7ID35_9ACTN